MVLRSGGDFAFRDVELLARHINGKWQSEICPRIICLWDKATEHYDLGNIEILPMWFPGIMGTWSRIQLFSPQMEQYKPFLYIDLDTAVIQSLENIFDIIPDETKFITLEDFWQRDKLATGLVWYPKDCEKTQKVWKEWKEPTGKRMDAFLRLVCSPDLFWQQLTTTIYDFKPRSGELLRSIPHNANLVCFHGKPRIFQVAEASISLDWVKNYLTADFANMSGKKRVTVIIPYNRDRGWLKEAINSVPKDVQLLISKGDGNWPENFNKVLNQAEGNYIRFLHEDDMLTENCIQDSVKAIEEQKVDFIHGNAYEIYMNAGRAPGKYIPKIQIPTMENLIRKNVIHSATLMYRREVFERIGSFDETLNTMEEYEFNLRCLKTGLKIGYCNSFLAWYRRHPEQKVRMVSTEEKRKEKALVNNKYLV